MSERKLLNTWKEIAQYLSRGVRTVQRWEASYRLPVYRANEEAGSVYAYADEIDAWLERAKPHSSPYVRPTFLMIDVITPDALSDLKLALEQAKFNVLTSFTSTELLATAARFDVDGFVIDSVVLDVHPAEVARELRKLYPRKPRLLLGDDIADEFDAVFPAGNFSAVVRYLLERFGQPKIDR